MLLILSVTGIDSLASRLQVRSEQQRVKEEAEKKLQRYIRQLDHFERARRDEEAPLIEDGHRKQVQPFFNKHRKYPWGWTWIVKGPVHQSFVWKPAQYLWRKDKHKRKV